MVDISDLERSSAHLFAIYSDRFPSKNWVKDA